MCAAQKDPAFQLLKTIKVEATHFVLDNLTNLYLITPTDGLKKYNAAGDSVGVYNNVKNFGRLYSIDVSNPLKLLLFYKDFSTIVLLDRQLSVRASLDLRKRNILQATAASVSYDNNIWLFDGIENKLKRIDEEGKLLWETVDFRMIFNEVVLPEQIVDRDGAVYLYDSNNGVYIFDHYGTFKKKYPIKGWKNLTITQQFVAGINNNSISVYNTKTLLQTSYQLPSSFHSFKSYIIGNTQLFALAKDSVSIYSFDLGLKK